MNVAKSSPPPPDPLTSTRLSSPGATVEECDICAELSAAGKHSQPPKLSRRGAVMLGVSGAFVAGVTAVMAPFVLPGLRRFALPYIPASSEQVSNVLRALRGRTGSLIDIGSGDGRITIAAAERGFQASGVELNRWLVWYSRWVAWRQNVHSETNFFRRDLWKTDLSCYKNVVIFGVETMMPDLEEKMTQELVPGTAVVACRFPLPSWQPSMTLGEGVDTVWLYRTPAPRLDDACTPSYAESQDKEDVGVS
ncbi:ATP synthase subunit C lysine N-methyltransferase [Aplysia californica]|uniref:ATP synthase subunit C lysine N-methyltransferase n=1 Tax=Aplysia californica TaxID=6500 RepID=A0ABM1W3W4_APLCA|nr:ATP synthase subunit C lysine N-methyltransferase [Aplysia californica]